MPDIMKKLVKGLFGIWAAFCTAIKAVSDDEIDNMIAEEKQSPTAPLRAVFRGFNINHLRSPTAPPLSEAQFFQSGTVGANNIMSGFQPGRGAAPAPPPAPAQHVPLFRANHLRHADLSTNTKNMVHYPDTLEGQIGYQAQVLMWKTANLHKYKGGDKYAPYPLTPDMLPVGTGKCHSCSLCHPMGTLHLRAAIDAFKTNYHCIAGHIIRTSRNNPPAAPKGEHKSGSPTSTCGFIRGKLTGQVTHRSEFLGGTGLCGSG